MNLVRISQKTAFFMLHSVHTHLPATSLYFTDIKFVYSIRIVELILLLTLINVRS
jgi:hypothetical protein